MFGIEGKYTTISAMRRKCKQSADLEDQISEILELRIGAATRLFIFRKLGTLGFFLNQSLEWRWTYRSAGKSLKKSKQNVHEPEGCP